MIVGIAGAGLAAFDAAQHCVLARFHLCRSAHFDAVGRTGVRDPKVTVVPRWRMPQCVDHLHEKPVS